MKILVTSIVAVALAAATVAAEDRKPDAPPTSQAEKMKLCSREAADKQLKGDDRRQFMSACLKGNKSEGAKAERHQ